MLALALSMDAFAVSVVNGLVSRANPWKNALATGAAFGFFQGLMPVVGYLAGHSFHDVIESVDHWIALALLCFVGGKMLVEACRNSALPEKAKRSQAFSPQRLGVQAVATSIDALAIGVWLGFARVNILFVSGAIAVTTFGCCFAGVLIGRKFGHLFHKKAEILGGVLLILIGIKIFLEHIGGF